MKLKKPFIFLKKLPIKLNRFYFNKSKLKMKINNKSKSKIRFNPVTNFDVSFEKFIRSLIATRFPQDSISGEELKDKKSKSNYKWLIDPIDGTKAFVVSIPTWSNLIGLTFKKKSVLGLANFPELRRFYISDNNKTFLFKNKKSFKLKSSKNHNLEKIKLITSIHKKNSFKLRNKLIKKFGSSLRFISLDALSYCLLAEGKIDVVIETNLKPHDIVPLVTIVKNAGGCITTWNNKNPELGGNILATANDKLHFKMIKLLQPF